MRQLIFLALLFGGGFFAWQYVMSRSDKRVTGKWGRRVLLASVCGFGVVLTLFAVLSITSWKLF